MVHACANAHAANTMSRKTTMRRLVMLGSAAHNMLAPASPT